MQYVALYDWMPQMDDQIRFYTGDCIQIVEKKEDGWWLGHLEGKSFCQGYIPSNYIQKKVTVQVHLSILNCDHNSSVNAVSFTCRQLTLEVISQEVPPLVCHLPLSVAKFQATQPHQPEAVSAIIRLSFLEFLLLQVVRRVVRKHFQD